MNFKWAMEMVLDGRKVRRKIWSPEGYIFEDNEDLLGAIKFQNGTEFWLNRDIIEASDWELFQETQ